MFNSGVFKFVIVAVLATVAVKAVAESYAIEGDFIERRPNWEFGFLKGKFYYLYDLEDKQKCRLRFDYRLSYLNESMVSNMYHYEDRAMYSMLGDKCSGKNLNERPEPWWLNDISSDALYAKSDFIVGDMFWFDRKPSSIPVDQSGQVKRILMKERTAPEDGYLGGIEFFDGRTVTFQNVKKTNKASSDPIFAIIEQCPRPTCPIYADIVFALDTSGSVEVDEWRHQVEFVNEVMSLFTFGPNAVEAAIVQWCGQDDGCPNTYYLKDTDIVTEQDKTNKCKGKKRYKGDCNYPHKRMNKGEIPADRMATVLAGGDFGNGLTVTPNRDELMRLMNATMREDGDCAYIGGQGECQAFGGPRGTCQALGLHVAMQVLDRSPRKNYNTKPHNIVIVVTDGEDKYPNMTAGNATLLKAPPYDAFLIEVGVGLQCSYDERYLKSIASQMGSEGVYFNASSYSMIKVLADKLFTPLCESNFSHECGPECKGFCGAGQCLCPDCDESSNVCRMIQCNVSGSFSNGCVVLNSTYKERDNVCVNYTCHPEMPNSENPQKEGEWVANYNTCPDNHTEHPGTCRNFQCDVEYGGCQVEILDSYCKQQHEFDACVTWECAPLGYEGAYNTTTGCKVKENYTNICEERLRGSNRSKCFKIECDGVNIDCDSMEVDTCHLQDTACMTYACTDLGNGDYGCVGTETPHAENTSCIEWVCNPQTGWSIYVERNPHYCEDKFRENASLSGKDPDEEVKCKNFYCSTTLTEGDIDGGCYYEERPGCDSRCNSTHEAKCKNDIMTKSNNSYCISDYCVIVQLEGENYVTDCASNNASLPLIWENCLDPNSTNGKLARQQNEANASKCYSPICDFLTGQCTYEEIPLPEDMITNKCTKPGCVQQADGSWNWEQVPTDLFLSCKSDACYIRECDGDLGCVPTENCSRYSNDCYSYSCVKGANDTFICNETNLTTTFSHLECLEETCSNGTKKRTYYPCVSEDKCLVGTCVKGYCVYTPKTPDENDICKNYTCNSTTGIWTATPNCDDGLFCTIDECWNYGTSYQCHHENVDCAPRLNMTGYDCFQPFCKENALTNEFKCIRKLRPNSYIDICGRCLKDNPDDVASNSTGDIFTNCAEAPPEPLTYEGLAAASIALIILGAIIAGGAVATSGVVGTKALISRAKDAKNLAAQCNPLFEGAETEMSNPGYAGES